MKLTISRELFRQRWLDDINQLTSYELQKKSWLDKTNKNPHWSYAEFICSYFDDNYIYLGYDFFIELNYISQAEYNIIKDWHNELDKYKEPKDDEQSILNDQKWINIVEKGRVSKENFKKIISNHEKSYLEKINYP